VQGGGFFYKTHTFPLRTEVRRGLGRGRRKIRQLIIRRRFVAGNLPAFLTLMNEHESLLPILIQSNRLHEATAARSPISWSFRIDMLGEEAFGAVIAICPLQKRSNERTAVLTGEGFFARNEHILTLKVQAHYTPERF